jgi:hypothetical protein
MTIWGYTFGYCEKIPEINNLREEKFILDHGFRDYYTASEVTTQH